MNDGKILLMENPYECWNLCKKTLNCVGIVWGKCDAHWVAGRFSCWLKSALVLFPESPWSVAIRYKGTTLCTFSKVIKKMDMLQQIIIHGNSFISCIFLYFVLNIFRNNIPCEFVYFSLQKTKKKLY